MSTISVLLQALQNAAKEAETGTLPSQFLLKQVMQNVNDALESPTDRIRRIIFQPVQNSTLRLAVEMGLPKMLAKHSLMTASELANETGVDEDVIVRVMRMLASLRLCDEQGPGVYSANRDTVELASAAFDGGTRFLYDIITSVNMVKYMHATNFRDSEVTPVAHSLGDSLWPYLDKHPELQQGMMDYMQGRRKNCPRWTNVFPASAHLGPLSNGADAVRIVDIGGNAGHDLEIFRESYPELGGRCVVQDLKQVIERAKPIERIEFQIHDMFTPQPVLGAQMYFLRTILHDWPDSKCTKILSNIVPAMKPGYSRLLISEIVLPESGVELFPASLDMAMLIQLSGKERTRKQWDTLLNSVGLEIVKIWVLDGVKSVDPVIEAVVME